jgi:hypothetical protein
MRNWQDMPSSTNIQDMTYGPQLPVAPWSMGPKQAPTSPPTMQQIMMMLGQRPPPTAAQNQAMQRIGMPAQLPTTPIAGSMPSGLAFWGGGGPPLVQSGPTSYSSIQPDRPGSHQVPTFIPGPLSDQWDPANSPFSQ